MRKQVSAITAYAAYVTLKNRKAAKAKVIINGCPDCKGTGKQGKRICGTCGGEKDTK